MSGHRSRQTQRQTDTEADRHRGRQTQRQTDTEADTYANRGAGRLRINQALTETGSRTSKEADRYIQTGRQTGRQTQTD